MTDTSEAEFSFLLWSLAAGLVMLSAHVAQGWVRMAHRGGPLRNHWRGLLLASVALGSGLCGATVLAMSAEALPFPLGFSPFRAALLWGAAVLGSMPALAWAARTSQGWQLFGSGALQAAVTSALIVGWFEAAGFRPGIYWRQDVLFGAVFLCAAGLGAAAWVAHSDSSQASKRRVWWRAGAALLVTAGVMAGQELVTLAAGLPGQQGSVYQAELPGAVLSLVCGGLLPLVLAVMSLDLWLRRRARRDRPSGFAPQKRRKRRHRVRQL